MNYEQIEVLHSKIANKLNNIIPTKWDKILLYAEVELGAISHYYCFYESNSENLVQFGEIADKYGIDSNQLMYAELELTRSVEELNNEFANNNQQRWTTLTFILQNDEDVDIDYGYENLSDTNEIYRRKQWKNKYLNM